MSKKKEMSKDSVSAKGFFRLQINEEGKVVGDTGWKQNQVVNEGFQDYLCKSLGAIAGSKQITHALLGTGTAPAAAGTSLPGELTDVAGMRMAVTPTVITSKTVQFAFTLASNVITAARTISNVGLVNTSTISVGTIFAGNTFTGSALATNQSVNGSYQIRFA